MSNSPEPSSGAVQRPPIEMPKPTVWPMVLSLALALSATGVALGSLAFVVVGGLLVLVSLWKWFGELLSESKHQLEFPTAPGPTPIPARIGAVERRKPSGYRARLPEKIYPVSAGLRGGLIGALVMPIPALAWGLLSGHGLFFPVNLLAGMVLPGVQNLTVPELEQFRLLLLVIGIIIHFVISAVIGLIYGVLLPLMPARPRWQLIFGGVIIPLVWTGFSGALMGIANPVLRHNVNWYWFALSQIVFGLAAASVVVQSRKIDVPPAGRGDSEGPERAHA
jgi:hypothetical protein